MTEADLIFERFPPFIREYIYSHGWESLRGVQIAAAKTLMETDHHLLLTSSTASGKTEAVFFPILTELYEQPMTGVSVLYIAPLKSLINDQFGRMDELLEQSGISVTRWHGDVAASHKNKLLKNPSGILQITPESLEAMLMHRSHDIPRIFSSLRYVVIDEIHTMMSSDRGNQILCQLLRVSRLIGHEPRRIGLSATVGRIDLASAWLGAGSTLPVDAPVIEGENLRWRLGMEHFFYYGKASEEGVNQEKPAIDAGYEYVYDCVKNTKALVFSNSREETEYVCATLRQIAKNRGERDNFLIHHGNLSASLREEAETKMKNDELCAVTCATVTMELGIDIGRLERVVQNDAPGSVSGLLQRLGRSGRRGQVPEMMMVFREEEPLPNTPLPQLLPWGLLRAIAIVQLYREERFIEPPKRKQQPFSLLLHQTLSILASCTELTARELAERVLSLPPFSHVSAEDYKELLVSMLNRDLIQLTDEKGLIIGLAGERLLGSFKFYAVFQDSEDFTVRCESEELGTITTPPPVGDRFALAGRVWEVLDVDTQRRLVYVKGVEGKMAISWPGEYGEIHTRILERMKQVLAEDTEYPYLLEHAGKRLREARELSRNTGLCEQSLVHLGGYTYCLFPWLGTASFRTLRRYIVKHAARFGISGMESDGCYYMTFCMERGTPEELMTSLAQAVEAEGIDPVSLVSPKELPICEKFDPYIPPSLLRYAYAVDRLNPSETRKRILEIAKEYER
ncbi:MAG: DEAD/DEAH box helicase [Ruminococcaceae bacterium]|nr:DEAD/DEAH box helicase [Oscillospiraceae bacterium]